MPKRKLPDEEKMKPASFSVDPLLKHEFNKLCYDLGSDPSKEVRKFMIRYIKNNKDKINDI